MSLAPLRNLCGRKHADKYNAQQYMYNLNRRNATTRVYNVLSLLLSYYNSLLCYISHLEQLILFLTTKKNP